MKRPEILGANLSGCAFSGETAPVWIAAAAAAKIGLIAPVAAVCNAPVVAIFIAGGWAA